VRGFLFIKLLRLLDVGASGLFSNSDGSALFCMVMDGLLCQMGWIFLIFLLQIAPAPRL